MRFMGSSVALPHLILSESTIFMKIRMLEIKTLFFIMVTLLIHQTLTRILSEVQPDEVYNLGAQSHVAVSFEAPEYTADVDAMGTLRLLRGIRFLG